MYSKQCTTNRGVVSVISQFFSPDCLSIATRYQEKLRSSSLLLGVAFRALKLYFKCQLNFISENLFLRPSIDLLLSADLEVEIKRSVR